MGFEIPIINKMEELRNDMNKVTEAVNQHTEQIRIMAGVQKHKSKQVNDLSVRLNQLEKQIEVLGGTILPSSD